MVLICYLVIRLWHMRAAGQIEDLKSLSNVIEEARSNWIAESQICLRDMSTQDWICGAHFSLAHFTRLADLATARYGQVKENH
jgi:glutathione S-transferase